MKQYTSLYFVGAGGIGMSALVRYFLAKGYKVAGYDSQPRHNATLCRFLRLNIHP